MTNDKIAVLLQKLFEKADDSEVTWEKTATDGQFQSVIGRYTLRLLESPNEFNVKPDYVFEILDPTGSVIESVTDSELQRSAPDFDASRVMSETFTKARRSAMGTDKALDAIIQSLDDIISF